jgi:hypothetical protein
MEFQSSNAWARVMMVKKERTLPQTWAEISFSVPDPRDRWNTFLSMWTGNRKQKA